VTITAKIIADSIAEGCPRITTLQLRYPRFIHAEVLTHRVFSRNASSSRAIPVERLIQDVLDDPAMPIYWGSNKPGMQAGEELGSGEYQWRKAMGHAVASAFELHEMGYHKQIVNRILEPFAHINVLVTATDWDNFFALRDHPDAQPEIQELAKVMKVAMGESEPEFLEDPYDYHIPYIDIANAGYYLNFYDAVKVSAASCASVSYKTVDGRLMTVDKALAICDKLMGDPLHASPFEHIARPCPENDKSLTRNFTGWAQYRAELEQGNGN
jgi:thymidylate synthase ThyX